MTDHPRVIFVCEYPWERIAKLGQALRSRGVPVMLLHLRAPTFRTADYFDYSLFCSSSWECLEMVMRFNPEVVHLFSMASDELAVLVGQHTRAKLVYDYKDMFENLIVDPPDQWRWQTQRFLVERAQGICARDRQIENYCRVNQVALSRPVLSFPDYCHGLAEPPRKPKLGGPDEVHLVMVGTFIPEDVYPQWMSHGYFFIAEALVKQGIHLHLYPTGWTYQAMNSRADSVYRTLAGLTPHFHLHPTVPVEKLVEEISQYDFGVILYQGVLADMPEAFHLNNHYEYGCAARMFDYLEAGLDVIVQDCLTTQAGFLREHEFGSLVGADFLETDMKSQLLAWKADPSRQQSVERARRELSIDAHADELLGFYRQL